MAKIRLFAVMREAAGTDRDEIDAASVAELIAIAKRRYGEAFSKSLPFTSIAINGKVIALAEGEDTPLVPGDEVAFLPPVSGGS